MPGGMAKLVNHKYLALNSPTTLEAVKIIIMEEVTMSTCHFMEKRNVT